MLLRYAEMRHAGAEDLILPRRISIRVALVALSIQIVLNGSRDRVGTAIGRTAKSAMPARLFGMLKARLCQARLT